MSEKVPKDKYIIDDEEYDDDKINKERRAKEKLTQEEIDARIEEHQKLKTEKAEAKLRKQDKKNAIKQEIKEKVVRLLDKGKVTSKTSLTNLLIKAGFKDYRFRISLIPNEIRTEIPHIGAALKELRFDKEINFTIRGGSHVYYTKNWKKSIKSKEIKTEFDWRNYKIPEGNNEIYVVFKLPGSNIESRHFLSSCYPEAKFWGLILTIDKKYNKTHGFKIIQEGIFGNFDEDKLIIGSRTSTKDPDKTLYKLIQIGRRIILELIKLNRRYSEVLVINNLNNTEFIPVIPIFRARDSDSFYDTKYENVLRIIYDFPEKFENKVIYGKYSILSKEKKEEDFDIKKYYDFIEETFIFQIKSFITNAILNDWIINPAKALNYMKEDEELRKLIDEYTQDIETDRIIQERLDVSMEQSELLKDLTSNLLLTFLGLSFLASTPIFQWGVVILLIAINILYIYLRTKRRKRKLF
jgi:hypothetical protein